jgi:transposase
VSDTLTIPLRREGEALLVGETKLPLELVLKAYLRGFSAEGIATRFVIPIATVYTLLAYYHQNKASLDAYLKEQEKKSEAYRKQIEENSARMGALIEERKAKLGLSGKT